MRNKTADKMFEDLRYKKIEETNFITYKKDNYNYIYFNLTNKTVTKGVLEIEDETSRDITIKELEAINKKCKELGWLDE